MENRKVLKMLQKKKTCATEERCAQRILAALTLQFLKKS